MNILTTNEISSNESSLESPLKPQKQKNKEETKNIFLINNTPSESLNNEKEISKNTNENNKAKGIKRIKQIESTESHMLDFDSLLNFISNNKNVQNYPKMGENRPKKRKNLIGFKRKRIKRNKKIENSKYIQNNINIK